MVGDVVARGNGGVGGQAGGVSVAHDLTLDGRAEDGAQNLHRHPWWDQQNASSQATRRKICFVFLKSWIKRFPRDEVGLTVRRSGVPLLLLGGDEHGEGRVWHMEALGGEKKDQIDVYDSKKKKYTSTFFETKFWTKFEEGATIWAEQIIYQLL